MTQFVKIRMPNGNTFIPSDWTSAEALYSTVEIGAGGFPVQTAFSYPRGGTVPGSIGPRRSTLADTNLQGEGARLPENEEIIIYQMAIEAFHIGAQSNADALPPIDPPDVSLLNMLRLQRDLLVVARIAYVKEYTRAPLAWFPAGTGTVQYNSAARSQFSAGASGYVAANNGGTSVCHNRKFASPLYVAGGESIGVDIMPGPGQVNGLDVETTPGASDDGRIRLRLYWEGYRRRPVA